MDIHVSAFAAPYDACLHIEASERILNEFDKKMNISAAEVLESNEITLYCSIFRIG